MMSTGVNLQNCILHIILDSNLRRYYLYGFSCKYQGQNSKNSTIARRIQHEEAVRAFEQKRSQRELLGFVVQMLELQET